MLERVHWLGHDSFRLDGSSVVYIDPWKLPLGQPTAHVVLVTHDHYDHYSADDIARVAGPDTVVVGPSAVTAKVRGQATLTIRPGETLEVNTATVTAVPAYNVDKFKQPGVVYHSRDAGHVGYIVAMDGMRIYHAGDTDAIPEMEAVDVDVALLPVGGTYTMTAEEAARACTMLRTAVAVPMHFGDIVGSRDDARVFERLCTVPVTILDPERD
jgi:L-ascorbate metabolism protein UlaG (beta-lactamase superfamily)